MRTAKAPVWYYNCHLRPQQGLIAASFYDGNRILLNNNYVRQVNLCSVSVVGTGSIWKWPSRFCSVVAFTTDSSSVRVVSQKNKASPRSQSTTQPLVSILNRIGELDQIPLEDVRNFCIIAHIDHGKSSLASRVLEYVGNLGDEAQQFAIQVAESAAKKDGTNNSSLVITKDKAKREQIQLLDTLAVEQQRGITVKASGASMLYRHSSAKGPLKCLLLNMVDTPGHVDFGFEVTRSLSSVEGAVILFDAAQGVQAQSLSVYDKATIMGVKLIPSLTKIDLENAKPLDVILQISDLFGFDPDQVYQTSARSRIGIKALLDAVCSEVKPPEGIPDDDGVTLRAKVIDSWFEIQRGVVCLLQVLSGKISEGDRISVLTPQSTSSETNSSTNGNNSIGNKETFSVQDIGLVLPHRLRTKMLNRGQMGYAIVGMRDPRQARPGSYLVLHSDLPKVSNMTLPITDGQSFGLLASSALYASVHPLEGEGFDELCAAVDRLALNDTGIEINRTAGAGNADGGPFLGPGLRVGFQGLLHVEVFRQRLKDEFGLEAIVTPPKVPYIIKYLPNNRSSPRPADAPNEVVVEDLSQWPDSGERFVVHEPMVNVRVMAPMECAGSVMELIKRKRGTGMETRPIDEHTWLFTSCMPWGEVVTDFHDELKNTTAGYGSFDTSEAEPVKADLVKVEIMLNGDVVEPLGFVCHRDDAHNQGRTVCKKLQEVLPRQQFVIVIQARTGVKIMASERIKAYRKDVLTKAGKTVGGGDITRKKKLLEKQKQGKKRQQTSGKVSLSQEAFNSVITRS